MIDIPALSEDNDLLERPPFSVPVKHFGHVLKTAEEVLGAHEFVSLKPGVEENIIPFAAIRPFLQSHIVEPEKGKPTISASTTTTTTKTVAITVEKTMGTTGTIPTLIWSTSNGDLEF